MSLTRRSARSRVLASVLAAPALLAVAALSACGPSTPSVPSPTPSGSHLATPYAEEPSATAPVTTAPTPAPSDASGSASPSGPISSQVPGTVQPSVSASAADEYAPTASLDGNDVVLVTFGSSSCKPTLGSTGVVDQVLYVELKETTDGPCTADIARQETRIQLKQAQATSVLKVLLTQTNQAARTITIDR